MQASARGVTVEVDDPVTRKQRSLYRASLFMPEGERFTDLYGILRWRPWIERAAQSVLESDHQSRRVNEVVERILAAGIGVCEGDGARERNRPTKADLDDIHWRVLEEAIAMVLEPLYSGCAGVTAGSARCWDVPSRLRGAWRMRTLAGEIRASLEAEPWSSCKWVIRGRIHAWTSGAARKAVIRALKTRIRDRRFIAVLNQVLKARAGAGGKGAPGAGDPVFMAGARLNALLADIHLGVLDEWLGAMPCRLPARSFHYGGSFMILALGPRDEVEAIAARTREYLDSDLGLGPQKVVLEVLPCEPGFEFLGFCFRRRRCGGSVTGQAGAMPGARFIVYPGKSAMEYYKSQIRKITSLRGSPVKDLDEAIIAINRVIEEWRVHFGAASSKRTFSYLDSWTRQRVFELLCKRHPGLPRGAVFKKFCPASGIMVQGRSGTVFLDRLIRRPGPQISTRASGDRPVDDHGEVSAVLESRMR
ncbi:MAG TPA: hypothetical protein GXX51_00820 [Firmicutes bacterium]|nr:hypothetical protein [Bacillota bacterium]